MDKSKKNIICILIFVLMACFSIYFLITGIISLNESLDYLKEMQVEYEQIQNGLSSGYGYEQAIKVFKEGIRFKICNIIFYLANLCIYATLVITIIKKTLKKE